MTKHHQPIGDARYDSLAAFFDSLALPAYKSDNYRHVPPLMEGTGHWSPRDLGHESCHNGRDVRRVMEKGWSEGRDKADKFLGKLGDLGTPMSRRRKLIRGDHGDTLDIHRVYAGQLDTAWSRAQRRATRAPIRVSICVNNAGLSDVPAHELIWRGVCAVALSDKLESAGYSTRLVVGKGGVTCGHGEKISCRIMVKDFNQPLNISTATAVMLPGFMRCLLLAWTATHARHQVSSGISRSHECNRDAGEIYIGMAVKCEATSRAMIEQVIRKLNAGEQAA